MTERLYNNNRWYRPGWGRYTQPDPIGLDGGNNLYIYADDKPEDLTDPSGLRPCGAKSDFIKKMCKVAKAAATSSCQCQVSLVNSGYETTWGDPTADSTKDNNWQGLHVKDDYSGKKRHPRKNPKAWVPINDSPEESWKQYCDRCKGFVFKDYPQYVRQVVKGLGMADPDDPDSQEDRITNMLQTIRNCKKELDECCSGKK